MRHRVIAIDGPAGSGKSTVARRVAQSLGITLLDTGAIYRALAHRARERGVGWEDGAALAELCSGLEIAFRLEGDRNRVLLDGLDISEAIRTPEISSGASRVSALPEVRAALLERQRRFAESGSLVAEGRDIGTVVFPAAHPKIFLVASPEERARRRHAELSAAGQTVALAEVLREQIARDAADEGRAVAPLRAALDAVTVDTSQLEIEEVVARILALVDGDAPPRGGRGDV